MLEFVNLCHGALRIWQWIICNSVTTVLLVCAVSCQVLSAITNTWGIFNTYIHHGGGSYLCGVTFGSLTLLPRPCFDKLFLMLAWHWTLLPHGPSHTSSEQDNGQHLNGLLTELCRCLWCIMRTVIVGFAVVAYGIYVGLSKDRILSLGVRWRS